MNPLHLGARVADGLASTVVDRAVNPGRDHAPLRDAVDGRTVLVTGASYGLGEATARRLARSGATLALLARTESRLASLADELRADGATVSIHPADLDDPESLGVVADKILAEHGHLDVVVNNAGKSMRRSLALQDDRFHDFTRTMNVNYLGPVSLLLHLLPAMRERGSGHVVNVSTIGVRLPPTPRWGAYQASKGAFDTWLRSVTPELASDGIDVSTIYMALMYTRMSAPTPVMRRLPGLEPDEAAELVARAIVGREREVAPWWVRPAGVPEVLGRRAYSGVLRRLYERSEDSASAQGRADEVSS